MNKFTEKKKLPIKLNLRVTMLLVSLFFISIVVKLSYVALCTKVEGTDLKEFSESRTTAELKLYANRGTIYDINGEELAKNSNSYNVIAYLSSSRTKNEENPQHVVDKEKTARELSPIINMSEETILGLLNRDNVYQVELGPGGREIGEDKKRQIEKLNLPGISFITSQKRTYKNKNYASYILGYVRKNETGELVGEMGIESYFNDTLKGSDGKKIYQKDAYGYQIPNTDPYIQEAKSGSDIYLSIDSRIQLILENAMSKLSSEHQMNWGVFSVMNAKTGAIVGSATNPTFNPNTLEDLNVYLNPLTSYQFEPGSTLKIFSFLAAMENGIYNGTDVYDSGSITLSDGTIINDWNDGKGWGKINFDTGFKYSSNVAATKIGLALGSKVLKEYYAKCGFGTKTGITLPVEANGQINFNYESELANAAFGQGMTATGIQMLQALSALANDGVMVKPYIVDKIVDGNGNTTMSAQKELLTKIASTDSINKIKKLMYDVVYDNPDNKNYAPSNMTIAGKTGTAQIPSARGGYEKGKYDYVKSFGGFFPYENPEYVFYFATEKIVASSSEIQNVISMALSEIAKEINLVETDDDLDLSKIVKIDNYISTTTEETKDNLTDAGLTPIVLGSGNYIINQYPEANSTVIKGSKVFLLTNKSDFIMPEVKGWSAKEIIQLCNILNIKYKLNNYGVVASTNVATGTPITNDTIMEINLSP